MKPRFAHALLIRISLIVAIVAGLAAGGLNFIRVKQKITNLQTHLLAQTAARQEAETELASATHQLATMAASLKETKAALEVTSAEKQKALATAATQTQRAEKLSAVLATTRQAFDEAQANLARYKAAGLEPEQIVSVARQLKDLQTALTAVRQENKILESKVKTLTILGPDPQPVFLPAGLKAKVVALDPKWHFIVLDAGEKQGVLERGELLVSRHGKLVAKARVSRVQTDRCVANLLPGWELGEVLEGDLAIPADPQCFISELVGW